MASIQTNNRPLPNFLGLDWGSPRERAKTVMAGKEGVIAIPAQSGAQNLVFEGGLYANKDVKMWVLQFANDQLHTGKILIAPPHAQTIAVFKDLTARLTRGYGEPVQSGIIVNPPFSAGQELEAIAAGKGVAAALYAFGQNNQLEGSILCQVAPNGQIVVNYQHEGLNQEAIASQTGLDAPVEGMPTMQTQSGGSGGGCFIATATLGNEHHPFLYNLRMYRDTRLQSFVVGRILIRFYYTSAPPLARVIEKSRVLRSLSYRYVVRPASNWSSRLRV